ncbi:MAG: DNA translocase FtsK 4TM domain-containing protein [Geminicoccaceae bacterium]|nr:DNA translocase FtsK 4TM domain-containing protein [Geminicoccaceae bacterium]
MAASSVPSLEEPRARRWVKAAARILIGAALLAFAFWLALALIGFDPTDPSFNHAAQGAGKIRNYAGRIGATVADVVLQTLGLAAWLLPLALAARGLRLLFDRPLQWPWLPFLALPVALLAACAFLADRPVPEPARWPFRTGLGGLVGDFLMNRLRPWVDGRLYGWITGGVALAAGILALGLRWGESRAALARVGRVSARAGRWLGAAAREGGRLSGAALRRVGFVGSETRPTATAGDEEGGEGGGRFALLRDKLRARFGALWSGRARASEETVVRPLRRPAAVRETEKAEDGRVEVEKPRRRPPERAPAPPPLEPARSGAASGGRGTEREEARRAADGFVLPSLDLLAVPRAVADPGLSRAALMETARRLEAVLDDFGVKGQIIDVKPGPVVTLFELEPAPGTRSQRVISLADDIARSLSALSVRVATVPGRNVLGIEVPNERRQTVFLRELLESEIWRTSEARLPLALGKDIAGQPVIVDLARMPHLLIAGTTGSGKSVAINAMILSLLYRLTPSECRIIMIDPKVIELSVYEDIPHLLAPVVTEPHKAVVALKWVVRQMDERYRLMSHLGVRDIFAFNRRIEQALARGETLVRKVRTGFEPGTGLPIVEDQPIDTKPLPLIVVIVDEVADLMLTAGKEIEHCIQRLSQKARAAGIHLIVATQRPSVDVLTGVIKANLPSRISFRVSSKIDSRTVLGDSGAEQLLGQGDMLYLMPGDRIVRVHGPLVTDAEVEAVVRHLKTQGPPDYHEGVTEEAESEGPGPAGPLFAAAAEGAEQDRLYAQAVEIVMRDGKASTSYLQRRLAIGYNSAAKLIERMEQEGLISPADHVGRRQVLIGRGGVDGTEPTRL